MKGFMFILTQILLTVSDLDLNGDERTKLQEAYKHTLQNLQQAEKYIQETKKSLEVISSILNDDDQPSKETTEISKTGQAIPLEMEDVIYTLDSMNVFDKIDTKPRPQHINDEEIELKNDALQETIDNLDEAESYLNMSDIKLQYWYNEYKQSLIIWAGFEVIASRLSIKSYIEVKDEILVTYPDTCGAGVCLVHSEDGNHHKIIFVLRNYTVLPDQYSLHLSTYISTSHLDEISLMLTLKNLTDLSIYQEVQEVIIPSVYVEYKNQSKIIYNEGDQNEKLYVLSTVNLPPTESRNPAQTIDTKDNGLTVINDTIQLEWLQSKNILPLFSTTVNYRSSDSDNFVWEYNIYRGYVLNDKQNSTKLLAKSDIRCFQSGPSTKYLNMEEGSAFTLECRIRGMDRPMVHISVVKNGKTLDDFAGFEISRFNFSHSASVQFTSYNVQEEDSGEYFIKAEDRRTDSVLTTSFSLGVCKEQIKIINFTKTIRENEVGEKEAVFTCLSRGNPKPHITFYIREDGPPEKLTEISSDDRFELLPTVNSRNMTSRQVIVHLFKPLTTEDHFMNIVCEAKNNFMETNTWDYVYNWDLE